MSDFLLKVLELCLKHADTLVTAGIVLVGSIKGSQAIRTQKNKPSNKEEGQY